MTARHDEWEALADYGWSQYEIAAAYGVTQSGVSAALRSRGIRGRKAPYWTKPNGPAFWNDLTDPRHGSSNGYHNLGCRCERCTAAWAEWHHDWMHASPDRLVAHAKREASARAEGRR